MGTLRLRLPFEGNYPLTQGFGDRPEVYIKWGFPGHEGLDWGMRVGTPILAVDSGAVGYLSTTGNYGNAIRLVHAWGESVYAHLSKFLVSAGQKVVAGQVIGLSGESGNVTGAHLHFGLRIAPFYRDAKLDPYQGFCNPIRYFEPSRFLMGPHIISAGGIMLPVLQRWQPPVATVLDPDPGFVTKLLELSPSTKVVGRIYVPDSEVEDRINRDPVEAARWMDNLVRSHSAYGIGKIAYWQIANEVCQGPNWDSFVKLATCMSTWMDLAGADYGCALFAFSVGNPDTPGNNPAWWKHITPVLKKAAKLGHVLAIHEYGWDPGLDGPPDKEGKPTVEWHAQRYVNKVRPLLEVREVQVVVTEFGYDPRLVGLKKGWRDSGMAAYRYANLLIEKEARYGLYRDQIMGVCVFTYGSTPDWSTYDIMGEVARRLSEEAERTLQAQGSVPVVPEPPSVTDLRTAALTAGKKQARIPLNPNAALLKAMAVSLYSPASDEFSFVFTGVQYIGQWSEKVTGTPGKPRLYYVPFGQWDQVRYFEL